MSKARVDTLATLDDLTEINVFDLVQMQTAVAALDDQKPVLGVPVSTPAASYDFVGIPSWAKKITVMFNNVSTNGTGDIIVQVGTPSFVTTGYSSRGWSGTTSSAAVSTGLFAYSQVSAANTVVGTITLTLMSPNVWVASGSFSYVNAATVGWVSNGVTSNLGAPLSRIRITTTTGNTFDAGSINIRYEA